MVHIFFCPLYLSFQQYSNVSISGVSLFAEFLTSVLYEDVNFKF
jgi:hypothetical protein